MTRLTIVVPCYNEAPVLHETTKRLLQVADTLTAKEVQTHILYVDDGSADETWQIIETESQTHSEVCGLKLAHNAGEMAFIPCRLFPTIEDIDVSVFSLYETYEMLGRKPVMAQEKLDIEAEGARDAGLLGLEQGDLVLLLECVSYDASGQAIEYVKSFNRGDAGGYTYTY